MEENVYNALMVLTKAMKSVLSIGPHGDDLRRVEQLDRELTAMNATASQPAPKPRRGLRAADAED